MDIIVHAVIFPDMPCRPECGVGLGQGPDAERHPVGPPWGAARRDCRDSPG